nr:T9SS type A sorting domain-containing protein [uncultured Flavobacterium sp.]
MKNFITFLVLLLTTIGFSQTPTGIKKIVITNPAAIVIDGTLEATPATCFGAADGRLNVIFKGGTGAYTYTWKEKPTQNDPQDWNNLFAGKYIITVTDENKCQIDFPFEISQPSAQLSLITTKTVIIPVTGNGLSTGSISIEATGGNGGYKYEWKNSSNTIVGTNSPTLVNIPAGNYTVKITDVKGCDITPPAFTVQEPTRPIVNESHIEAKCSGLFGSLQASASGGAPFGVLDSNKSYTYILTNKQTLVSQTLIGNTASFTNIVGGNYDLTVKDEAGIESQPILVTFKNPTSVIITSINQTQPSSSTANDGTITINASGGTGTYTYFVIKDGGSEVQYGTNVITGLQNGSYEIFVRDSNQCPSDTRNVKLEALTINLVQQENVKCHGENTGSITINASGGTLSSSTNYTYQWYKNNNPIVGQINPSISGLGIGNYYITVSDNIKTIPSQPFNISQPIAKLQVSIDNKSDISCPEANDGAITLKVTGGTGSYAYQWDDNATTKDRTNLKEGTYKVTVKDDNSCTITSEDIKIVSPSAITIPQPTISNVSIYGQNTGAIKFSSPPSGGVGTLIYSWTSDKFSGSKNSLDLSNLEAGKYKLVVRDDNGCTNSKTFEVTQNPELKVNINEIAFIKCFGGTNGKLTAEVTGGVAPYAYVWKKGNEVIVGENQSTITNLGNGMYSVYVTDSANLGGPYAQANQLNYDLKEPNELKVSVINSTNVLCHDATTGAISIAVEGGNAPYTYQWKKNGADYPITTKDIINLGAGTYQVIVTDAVGHNCTAILQDAVVISHPNEPLQIKDVSKSNLTGFETNNGSIGVTVIGGTPDYSYEWRKDADPTIIGTTASITNLSKGMYHLLVKDKNGCSLPQVDYEITQPDKLEIVLTPTPNTELKCFGATTAEYKALITGGVKEYTLEWLNTTTGQKYSSIETITPLNTISVASNLAYGDYVVSVKDAQNNILFGTNTFTIHQPDVLAFTYNTTPVSCFGGANGSIQLTITGGTKSTDPNNPYSISSDGGTIDAKNGIISGLAKGKYLVQVTDANGCSTAQQEIEILAPEKALYITSEVSTPTTGYGLATGEIEISVDGGTPLDPGNGSTPTYSYVWKNSAGITIGTNNPILSNIAAGEYSVVITDAKGCELPKTFTVEQPTQPLVSETHLQAKCNGLTGSLEATATGGAPFAPSQSEKIYTYNLKNKTTGVTESITGNTATFTNIVDGEYELTATDVAGIISNTIPVTFKQPTLIVVNLIQKNVSCYNGNDGSLEAVVFGGTAPYTYIWKKGTASIGSNTSKIEGLSKNDYSLEIRDNNYNTNWTTYCIKLVSTSITEPSNELAISSFTSSDATGYQTNNGKIEVNPSGGTPNYKYQWFFNGTVINNQSNNNLSNLAPGEYKVIITDANLICSIEKTFIINEPKLLELKASTTKVLCYGEQNGRINAIATGGVKDNNGFYTYTLFDMNKNVLESQKALEAKFDTKFAGTYYIQVTDFNSNTTPSNVNDLTPIVIEQPNKALTLVEIKKNNATCPNEADGSILFETSGGTPNYKYTLLNVNKNTSSQVNDSAISNLSAGTYTLTVTDSNDCVQSNTFTITEPEDFGFDKEKFTLTKPILPETNWSINVVVKGGQNDYKYSIKNSSGNTFLEKVISEKSLLIHQLPTDIYTVSVTDNTGCTKTEIIDLTNNVLTASIQQTKQIICNGEGANIKALVTGGLGIKTYTWYKNNEIIPLENGTTLTNYGPGEYKFSCIDTAKLEIISNTITVTQPDVVEIKSILKTNSTCYGANDGSITINAIGGSGSFLYSLDTTTWTAFPASTTAIINNLPIGDYTVYVKDSNGCNAIATAPAKIEQPGALTITKINTTSTSGFGLNNGSISIIVDGGNGNYAYGWYDENKKFINQSSSSAINLVAGKYYVEITDSKNCSTTSELITISQPEKLLVAINPINQVIYCYGDKSIQLTATVSGGVPTYNYEWYDNSNLLIGTNPTSPFVGAGSYYLKISDKNGNVATSSSISITEPQLTLTSHKVVDVSCFGGENGSIIVNASGGSNDFEYRFKQDNTSYGNWISFTSNTSTIHEGLKAGKYTFQIKDKNGILCSNVPNIEVSITQPLAPISLINTKTIVTPASGFGLANGSITVEATGGNGNYTYKWFKNGSTTTIANTATANNLAAGKYFVMVTDAKGCTLTSPLIEVTEPALLVTAAAVQNIILCNGDSNGSLRPITSGGFLKPGKNYTYQWFADGNATPLATSTILSGIGKGSYYVIATDSNGNKATSKSIVLTEPEILNNSLAADYTLCGDANDWTITTASTGGTPIYNYSWNTGAKTPSIQNVPPGKYSVIITDKNGCYVTQEISITAPLHLATTAQINKPTCHAGTDASIVLTTVGGKAPYTYLWSTGAQSSQLSNVQAGNYSVTITDAKGCIITEQYTIENPPKDVINLGEDVTLCIDQTLTINATINDDKATYFWQSDKGFTSNKPIVTLKEPANYTLTITNKLGCQASDTITISSQNTPISAEFALSSQVFTNEVFTIIDISNPRPDSIEWILPAEAIVKTKNKDYAEMSFPKTGEYEITMTSKKGNCTAFQTKKVLVIEGEYKDPDSTDAIKNFDLKIYPNPSNGIFTIDVTLDKVMPATIKIFSLINNSIITSKSENGKQAYLFDFGLNGLAPGVYFILFESQQGSKLRKIIIQ